MKDENEVGMDTKDMTPEQLKNARAFFLREGCEAAQELGDKQLAAAISILGAIVLADELDRFVEKHAAKAAAFLMKDMIRRTVYQNNKAKEN